MNVFFLLPADKAEGNVIVVCKEFYKQRVVRELVGSEDSCYEEVLPDSYSGKSTSDEIRERFQITVPLEHESFSSFYWTAKMHKNPVSQRFIAASNRCCTKTLSSLLTTLLGELYKRVCFNCTKMKRNTGVDHCWIAQSSQPILKRISYLNSFSGCQSVESFDFKNLYTSIPHQDLKEQLKWVVDEAFSIESKNGRAMVGLCVSGKFAHFVDRANGKRIYGKSEIVEMVNFLIDHIFISCGGKDFRQMTGIPMGTDCGPLLANLYLFALEYKSIRSKWVDVNEDGSKKSEMDRKSDRNLAKAFANAFRYIDDLITINNRGVLESVWKDIYPHLMLEKQNQSNLSTEFLDLTLTVKHGFITISPYDKRDAFPFDVVCFANQASNIHFRNSHGVLISQLLRFSRNCDKWADFNRRSSMLITRLIRQGFSERLLQQKCRQFYNGYSSLLKHYHCNQNDFVSSLFV